ncbi:MAG: flagellar hook-length control protein FliK [Propionivibrio sp.]
MPITIVSAPPKINQASVPEAGVPAEGEGAGNDFASMLLGQLSQAGPGISGVDSAVATLESLENKPEGNEESGEDTAPNDPLALLAALSQAPVEQRNDATAALPQAGGTAPLTNGTSAPSATPIGNPADVTRQEAPEVTSPAMPETTHPAYEQKAAKFAAPAPATSRENMASTSPQAPEMQTAGTNEAQSSVPAVQAGAHAIRQDGAPLVVPTPVRDRDWNNDFAQKVVWLATSHKQAAELTLTPPQMGNIEISLKIDNGTSSATATFVSTNAEVRETIEAALPRLREMLAGVGIDLGQANVSAESFRQQASGQDNGSGSASRLANDNAILAPDAPAARTPGLVVTGQGRGLVDIFA